MILGAKVIVALAVAYVATGLAVGLAFLVFQLERQDPAARGAYAFRPLLLPGLALLWPLVLLRWISQRSDVAPADTVSRHKRVHRVIWSALALLIMLVLGLAYSSRSYMIPETPSLRLSQVRGGPA